MSPAFRFWPTVLAAAAALALACCGGATIPLDPASQAFYETARLVMTDAERDIFNHLPDEDSRREFIKEFWDKRDPDPDTEENEFRTEFEKRLEYVNKRFLEGGRGLNTDRGRVYVYLGPPDKTEQYAASPLEGQMDDILVWIYYRYDLGVVFRSPMGQNKYTMSVEEVYGDLINAVEMAKLGETYTGGMPANYLNFSLKYDSGTKAFVISIPAKRINFKEEAGKLRAEFDLDFTVYRPGTAETVRFRETRVFEDVPEAIQKSKSITLVVARDLPPGRCYVDVVVIGKDGVGKARKIFPLKI